MTSAAYLLVVIGVGYTASLLTRFLIWLDTPREKRPSEKLRAS